VERRELFRILGASAALAGLSPAQLAALWTSERPSSARRAFFSAEQRAAVDAMADLIIPETDTPGASAAGVTDFIEVIVSEWYDSDDRALFMRGLDHVDEHAMALTGVRFARSSTEAQTAMLSGLQAEGAALVEAELNPDEDTPPPFFHRFRGLVLHGYYTSEIGQQELMFLRLPGRFEGCVDLESVTRPRPESWPPEGAESRQGGTRG